MYTTSAGAGLGTTVESKTERVRAACEHRNMPCEVIDLNNEPQRRSELISEYGEPLAADIELPQIYLGEQLLSEGFAEFQTLLDDDKLPNPEELRLRARRELVTGGGRRWVLTLCRPKPLRALMLSLTSFTPLPISTTQPRSTEVCGMHEYASA